MMFTMPFTVIQGSIGQDTLDPLAVQEADTYDFKIELAMLALLRRQ